MPAEGTYVRAPTSPACNSFRTPSVPTNISREAGALTFQTTPKDVAEVRVNPPKPSMDRIISFLNGAFTKRYLTPKSLKVELLVTPDPSISPRAASAIAELCAGATSGSPSEISLPRER